MPRGRLLRLFALVSMYFDIIPALAITTSHRPHFCLTSFSSCATLCSLCTSHSAFMTWHLLLMVRISLSNSYKSPSVRELMLKPEHPAFAYARLICQPRPFPAPVTTTTKGCGSVVLAGSMFAGILAWMVGVKDVA